MSIFFPFGFSYHKDRGPEPDTGCPLENNSNWSLKAGPGPSTLCWESSDGSSVSVAGSDDVVRNLAFRSSFFADGKISARIAMVSTSTDNWILPLCARMINVNNLVGARWNNSKFEIVQRKVGTWSTLFSGGPVPALDDVVELLVVGNHWRLVVNGVTIQDGTLSIAQDSGHWGISTHKSDAFIGHTLLHDLAVLNAEDVEVTNDNIPVTFEGGIVYHL